MSFTLSYFLATDLGRPSKGEIVIVSTTTLMARKPFHETIIELLEHASNAELKTLGSLLIRTTIPKDHDKIIAAWNARCTEAGWRPDEIQYVAADIFRHKRDIEALAIGKTTGTRSLGEKGISQMGATPDGDEGDMLRL